MSAFFNLGALPPDEPRSGRATASAIRSMWGSRSKAWLRSTHWVRSAGARRVEQCRLDLALEDHDLRLPSASTFRPNSVPRSSTAVFVEVTTNSSVPSGTRARSLPRRQKIWSRAIRSTSAGPSKVRITPLKKAKVASPRCRRQAACAQDVPLRRGRPVRRLPLDTVELVEHGQVVAGIRVRDRGRETAGTRPGPPAVPRPGTGVPSARPRGRRPSRSPRRSRAALAGRGTFVAPAHAMLELPQERAPLRHAREPQLERIEEGTVVRRGPLAEQVIDHQQPGDLAREVLVGAHRPGQQLAVARLGFAVEKAGQRLVS